MISSAEIGPEGEVLFNRAPADQRFLEPYSGLYYQVSGAGFDLGAVASDRHGVRSSIVDRMERHGGRADVRSAPGEGTEIRLHMTRHAQHQPQAQAPTQAPTQATTQQATDEENR